MAKNKCPGCGKRFDYEYYGWICPECGYIILGNTENDVQPAEKEDQESREAGKKESASDIKGTIKKLFARTFLIIAVITELFFGLGIALTLPDIIKAQRQSSSDPNILKLDAQMNDVIIIDSFSVKITDAYMVDKENLTAPYGGRYLAVKYQSAGENRNDSLQYLSDIAWAGLYDKSEGKYILPLSASDMTGSDEVYSELLNEGVTVALNRKEGTLVFLVKDTSFDYELCIVSGEDTGYSQYDIRTDTVYRISLDIQEKTGGDAE